MADILVVEDEKILRDATCILLRANGHAVEEAANGEEALAKCQDANYDLILLDLMMPVLDGIGFLQEADLSRTSPRTKVVVMSNLSSTKARTQIAELGEVRHEIKSNLAPKDILRIVTEELTKRDTELT